jgi:hypothetical protein
VARLRTEWPGIVVLFLAEAQDFSSSPQSDRLWVPAIIYPGCEVDHSPPSEAEVKAFLELYLHSPTLSDGVVLAQGHYLYLRYFPVRTFAQSCCALYAADRTNAVAKHAAPLLQPGYSCQYTAKRRCAMWSKILQMLHNHHDCVKGLRRTTKYDLGKTVFMQAFEIWTFWTWNVTKIDLTSHIQMHGALFRLVDLTRWNRQCTKFEVFTAVKIDIVAFYTVTPCNLVGRS